MNYFLPSNSTSYHHQQRNQPNQSTSAHNQSTETNLDHEASNIQDWTKIEINSTSTSNHQSISFDHSKETQLNLIKNIRLQDSPITNLDQSQLIFKLLPNENQFNQNQIDSLIEFDSQAWKRGDKVKKINHEFISSDSDHHFKNPINLIPISNQLKRVNKVNSNKIGSNSNQFPLSSSSIISTSSQQSNTKLPRWRSYISLSRTRSKKPNSNKTIDNNPDEEVKEVENQISSKNSEDLNKSNPKRKNEENEEEEEEDISFKDWLFKINSKTLKLIGISSLLIIFGIGIINKKQNNLNRFKSIILKSFKPLSILYHF